MNSPKNHWVSFAAPLLVLLAIFGLFHRKDNDRVQSLPALIIGAGLMLTSTLRHQIRRKKILLELKKINEDDE